MPTYHRRNMDSSYEFVVRNTETGEIAWTGFTVYKSNAYRLREWMTRTNSAGSMNIDEIARLTGTKATDWHLARKAAAGMHCPGTPWVGVWTGRTAYQINGTRDCPRLAPAPAAQ